MKRTEPKVEKRITALLRFKTLHIDWSEWWKLFIRPNEPKRTKSGRRGCVYASLFIHQGSSNQIRDTLHKKVMRQCGNGTFLFSLTMINLNYGTWFETESIYSNQLSHSLKKLKQ